MIETSDFIAHQYCTSYANTMPLMLRCPIFLLFNSTLLIPANRANLPRIMRLLRQDSLTFTSPLLPPMLTLHLLPRLLRPPPPRLNFLHRITIPLTLRTPQFRNLRPRIATAAACSRLGGTCADVVGMYVLWPCAFGDGLAGCGGGGWWCC